MCTLITYHFLFTTYYFMYKADAMWLVSFRSSFLIHFSHFTSLCLHREYLNLLTTHHPYAPHLILGDLILILSIHFAIPVPPVRMCHISSSEA